MQRDTRPPTRCQIETVRQLIQDTGNDPEWYEVERMSRGQVARLIDKLRDELERGENERRYIQDLINRIETRRHIRDLIDRMEG